VPFIAFALFPFYYMVITSLKNDAELYQPQGGAVPDPDGRDHRHYRYLLAKTEFLTWIKNSPSSACWATSISLAISILAGYSLAGCAPRRGELRHRRVVTYLVRPAPLPAAVPGGALASASPTRSGRSS